jgi:hypothetical protein
VRLRHFATFCNEIPNFFLKEENNAGICFFGVLRSSIDAKGLGVNVSFIKKIFFAIFAVVLFGGCMSTSEPCLLPRKAVFPKNFSALQVVRFSKSHSPAKRVLVSLERKDSGLRVSLMDGILQLPLADFELKDGKVARRDVLVDLGPFSKEEPRFLASLYRFYSGLDLECRGDGLYFSDGPISLEAKGLLKFEGCFFPERIGVRVRGAKDLEIEVRTEELTCRT